MECHAPLTKDRTPGTRPESSALERRGGRGWPRNTTIGVVLWPPSETFIRNPQTGPQVAYNPSNP